LRVPSNWREFGGSQAVQFAPEGGYGDQGITHFAMIGLDLTGGDLAQATEDYLNSILQSNSYLRQRSSFSRTTVAGRSGYTAVLSGRSPVTGRTEIVTIYTTQLRSGELFYAATVVPETDSSRYSTAFRTMINSIRLNG
jgi:hypothetical protein